MTPPFVGTPVVITITNSLPLIPSRIHNHIKIMYYHISPKSNNAKTGPIPVTTTSADSCPPSCPFSGGGCYAKSGPLALHWARVSQGARGGSLDELTAFIAGLPAGQLYRHNQAGDLPGEGEAIDGVALRKITKANTGKRGFTYTHKYSKRGNLRHIKAANDAGFVVNLSANSPAHADELADTGVGPVVCVLDQATTKNTTTPAGRKIVVCPATVTKNVTCSSCGLCARSTRSVIIGFPAHGTSKRKASAISNTF